MESSRCQLFDCIFLFNAVAASILGYSFDGGKVCIRWKVNDRELSPNLQSTYQILIKVLWVRKVMIHAPQKNCVAAIGRKFCVISCALYYEYILELAPIDLLLQVL